MAKRRVLCLWIVFLGLCLPLGRAAAAPVTFGFSGVLAAVDPRLEGPLGVTAGAPWAGSVTFDSEAANLMGESNTVHGWYEVSAFAVDLGPHTFELTSGSSLPAIQVGNFDASEEGSQDVYGMRNIFLAAGSLSGYPSVQFDLLLVGPADIFSSAALPLSPPDLSRFPFNSVSFVFTDELGEQASLAGSMLSLTAGPAPVPEPGTVALLGTGLFGLCGAARLRRSGSGMEPGTAPE